MKSRHVTAATLARMAVDLKRHGITHDAVAAEAAKSSPRGHVTRTMVSHVLKGRTTSANVVAVVKRLIADAKATVAA